MNFFRCRPARRAGRPATGRAYIAMICAMAVLIAPVAAQTPTPPPAEPAVDDLYKLGKQLFEQLAPAEIKEQYEFPSKERWDEFATRFERALQDDDLAALAAYAPEARAALTALRALPGYEDYADWLEQRLDEIIVARDVTARRHPI